MRPAWGVVVWEGQVAGGPTVDQPAQGGGWDQTPALKLDPNLSLAGLDLCPCSHV